MDVSALFAASQVAHIEQLPPRGATFALPRAALPSALDAALRARGIGQLYTHQAAALDAARSGQHVGVVTGTASGKTLCYQLPTLEALLADPQARALFLFPTRALAGDQLRSLRLLAGQLPGVLTATLDGDTPRAEREQVRARAGIILSNPDLLHRTLLPDHRRWAAVLANLRYVVLDEAHVYRGVFGSHVALVLRRLRRICRSYGADPRFICCSATSANPAEHLAALIGAPVTLIADDGAPQGPRSFVLWNPPLRNPTGTGPGYPGPGRVDPGRVMVPPAADVARRSTNSETAALLASLVRSQVKTLAFTRTRRGAELVLRYTRELLADAHLAGRIAAYRAGYTSADRRRLEQAFLTGELLGLVSTNALELGVDIGGVDAVVMAGFPGTIASAWQQAGRAGRAQADSLAVLVAQDDPLDQFYMRHPAIFFSRPVEHARIALDNPYILADQLRCAGAELPLCDQDEQWFGPRYPALRDWLARRGDLHVLDDGRAATRATRPAADVNIRSADGTPLELRDAADGRVIEQLAATRAPNEAHPGAVYLHQGDAYVVHTWDQRVATARRADPGYYTQALEETDIQVLRVEARRAIGPVELYLGPVEVTRTVVGYRRKQHFSDVVLGEHALQMPPQRFRTVAVWWTVPENLRRQVAAACGDPLDGLHALEHACIGLLPLYAQCDRADIGGLSTDYHPDTDEATIFVYDGVPGGVGISQIGYEQAEAWWAQTATLLAECACSDGCPACTQSPRCGNGNQHLSKLGALTLARLLGPRS